MSIEDIMSELKEEYLQSLPSKIEELQGFADQGSLEEAINAFHKLKGSGKTYGFPEVSELGELCEISLKQNPKHMFQLKQVFIILEKIYKFRLEKKMEYPLKEDSNYLTLFK